MYVYILCMYEYVLKSYHIHRILGILLLLTETLARAVSVSKHAYLHAYIPTCIHMYVCICMMVTVMHIHTNTAGAPEANLPWSGRLGIII